jgi:hypothetical protein
MQYFKSITVILAFMLIMIPSITFGESCGRYIQGMWDGFSGDQFGPGHWFTVKGSRVTARGTSGYTSYAASPSFRQNMTLAEKARNDYFSIWKNRTGNLIEGRFLDVFPGRADGVSDLTSLRIFRTNRVQLILHSWGNSVIELTNLQCYRGHENSTFVLTGQQRSASHGINLWTFTITPAWLH